MTETMSRPTSTPGRVSQTEAGEVHIGIFLPEGYPLAPLSMIIETLRLANLIEHDDRFSYQLISEEGNPVRSSCAFPAPVTAGIGNVGKVDVLLVCAGMNSVRDRSRALGGWLRQAHAAGLTVGGISSGAFLLAQAGLLDGRTCAIHWETEEALRETFHRVTVSGDIFCIDGRIITCAGGISTLDLMLHLVAQFRDRLFARRLADLLIYPAVRAGHEPARINLRARTGISNPTVLRAIEIMEANVETPLKISEICEALDTSPRHLERLFARTVRMSPSQYFMRLRLREAKGLLALTDISVVEVALRCGFSNAAHFSRRFRETYDAPPRDQRNA